MSPMALTSQHTLDLQSDALDIANIAPLPHP
jgi:hypothetical protein